MLTEFLYQITRQVTNNKNGSQTTDLNGAIFWG